jgi:hypothetical protein
MTKRSYTDALLALGVVLLCYAAFLAFVFAAFPPSAP